MGMSGSMRWVWAGMVGLVMAGMAGAQQAGPAATPQSGKPALQPAPSAQLGIDAYIHKAWTTLERRMTECTTLVDPKVRAKPVLYLPQDFPEPADVAALGTKCGVEV